MVSIATVFLIIVVALVLIYQTQKNKDKQVTYDQLYQDILNGKIKNVHDKLIDYITTKGLDHQIV